jgi:lipoprotein-anchoring transpeptidase ErfK/SrfK
VADSNDDGGAHEAGADIATNHGELDTKAPQGSPKLAATVLAATIYKLPNVQGRKLGYVRLGGQLQRDDAPTNGNGCQGKWYRVYPAGYACTDEFTTDTELPIVRAAAKGPDLNKPLPYRYGFIRATAPQYLRIPSHAEQEKSELQLAEHLTWYQEHEQEVQKAMLGANDVPLDARGFPASAAAHAPGFRASSELSLGELLGGNSPDDPVPFWLEGGRRIPNVSGFDVPASAIFANRVRRKTGLSFVGSFNAKDNDFVRRFAISVDLRLIPATKIKPDSGSAFHGIELKPDVTLPLAWIIREGAKTYKLIRGKDEARPVEDLPKRVVVPLTGEAHIKGSRRYYQTRKDNTRWLNVDDISIVSAPAAFPEYAERGEKWIDISLRQQTLTLYEGKRPVYTTLVSTGRDRLGDPKTSYATPQGTFRLRSKHIAAAMDSEAATLGDEGEGHSAPRAATKSSGADKQATIERLQAAEKAGAKLSADDQRRLMNIKKGRDPEYGVTERRGATGFELRDVPWIEYFASGYALHGAYWHDSFGIPRSHGCVNLSPVDARVVFLWTDPPVPSGWQGINVGSEMGEGTAVVIHE